MKPNDESVLLCLRVSEAEPGVQSTVGTCDKCGAAIWIANSSPRPKNIFTRCTVCVVASIPLYAKIELEPLTKKQLRDAAHVLKK
jgi:hypothetical protein